MIYFIARYLIPKRIKVEVVTQLLSALEYYAPNGKGSDATIREVREHLAKWEKDIE